MVQDITIDKKLSKEEQYQSIIPQIASLIKDEDDLIASLGNLAAVLKYRFNFFWVGFYLFKSDELVLGPFQGPVACTRIKPGKGVCGIVYESRKTIVVPDVTKFKDHIACSSKTKSEIVLPVIKNGKVIAVLDVDSEILNDFDETDSIYLEQIVKLIENKF